MSVQQVPLGSVTIGAPAWRESTELSLRRACRLLRQTGLGPGGTAAARPRTPPTLGCPKHASTEDKTEKHGDTTEDDGNGRDHADSRGGGCSIARPQTVGTTFPPASKSSTLVPSQAASLRERCARQSTATAGEYMRWVREVELRLRRQAGRSSQEIAKLERERAHLEMMLRSIRNDLQVNRESAGQRTERRPQRDGADLMLAWERRELTEMKHDVEETLRKTQQQLQVLDESSRDLQMWSSQQALVLVLLPHRGSVPTPHPPPAATRTLPPTYGFTSESEQVLDSSSLAINQSQRLREQIRHALSEVVARQRASQHVVNGGLVKKVAETVTLERSLVLTAAATRHAASRKQREVDSLRLSHGRAQGPESSSDVFCRERLGRPVVQVYQRHPGTELPEATHLLQGSAVLGYRLGESEDDAARLRRCFLQLCGEARGKRAAARRDTTVVRMRLQRGDKRVIPHILQQGEPKVTQEDDPCSHRNINEGPQ
ncbi:coiled-coil domain-containing protein 105 [Gadus morhua]|uniref:coiled-coil domain-containing protein 105 n=1 Tax=Gadus morhua TaxID=8049 RepID=UPI0011B4D519|nr:coiled-coil domain-containing protein 105 [Gadus morhua]